MTYDRSQFHQLMICIKPMPCALQGCSSPSVQKIAQQLLPVARIFLGKPAIGRICRIKFKGRAVRANSLVARQGYFLSSAENAWYNGTSYCPSIRMYLPRPDMGHYSGNCCPWHVWTRTLRGIPAGKEIRGEKQRKRQLNAPAAFFFHVPESHTHTAFIIIAVRQKRPQLATPDSNTSQN